MESIRPKKVHHFLNQVGNLLLQFLENWMNQE